MIASMHLLKVGPLRAPLIVRRRPHAPGLLYADLLLAAHLGGGVRPRPDPRRVALFAVWSDDAALDRYLAEGPLATVLEDACTSAVRLQPLRIAGSWTGLPQLVDRVQAVADDEPVAILTYGRLKLHRVGEFLRTSARAEADALEHPGLAYGTGLARLPRLVSTFSLWHSAEAMRDFARAGKGHTGALDADARRAFHHESIFVRFRPYRATGDWTGLDAAASAGQPQVVHTVEAHTSETP